MRAPRSRVRPTSPRDASAAAEPPPRGSPEPSRAARVKELLVQGVVYEFIAIPCGYRYTMPLGLRWGEPPKARVYRGTGLYSLLAEANVEEILLYAPVNPLDFALSITHQLDRELGAGCKPPRPFTVAYYCKPRIVVDAEEYIDLECPGNLVEGTPIPYTRLYGAIIELLVVASKAGAGVVDPGFASACMQCGEWAARRAGGRAFMDMQEPLQAALKTLLGPGGLPEGV